jgi:hypothetical protein
MTNRRYGESVAEPSQTRRGKRRMRRNCAAERRGSATAHTSKAAARLSGVVSASTALAECGAPATYTINRHGRFWEVRDAADTLVCLTVYKCGAQEVIRRLDTSRASDAIGRGSAGL